MNDVGQQDQQTKWWPPQKRRFVTDWDVFATTILTQFLHAVQHIPIRVSPPDHAEEVTVYVHAPYMQGAVAWLDDTKKKLSDEVFARLVQVKHARTQAPITVKYLLQQHLYTADGQEKRLAQGRAEWTAMQRLLQTAVDAGLVPAAQEKQYPDRRDCRAWLQTYGIGLDCSAFVQQALTQLIQASYGAAGQKEAAIGRDQVGWIRSVSVFREIQTEEGNGRFISIPTAYHTRPGDVLVRSGHIRIVLHQETAINGLVLHLAESTSKAGALMGSQIIVPDVGPQRIQVTYPLPHAAIANQTPLVKRPHDNKFQPDNSESTYILGRLKAFTTVHT